MGMTELQLRVLSSVAELAKGQEVLNPDGALELAKHFQEIEYIYVKDLPDVGGLRAGRMANLRATIEDASRLGWRRCVVFWQSGRADYVGVQRPEGNPPGEAIEIYDLTQPLAPQFAENRALHW